MTYIHIYTYVFYIRLLTSINSHNTLVYSTISSREISQDVCILLATQPPAKSSLHLLRADTRANVYPFGWSGVHFGRFYVVMVGAGLRRGPVFSQIAR